MMIIIYSKFIYYNAFQLIIFFILSLINTILAMKLFYFMFLSTLLSFLCFSCSENDKTLFHETEKDDKYQEVELFDFKKIKNFQWSQILEGKEVSALANELKEDNLKESPVKPTFKMIEKDERVYDIDFKYYKENKKEPMVLAKDTFEENKDGSLISTTDNKVIEIYCEKDDKIRVNDPNHIPLEYFRSPKMEELYGTWKVVSDNDHFISEDLIKEWENPKDAIDDFQAGMEKIDYEKYKLEFFENPEKESRVYEGQSYGSFRLGNGLETIFRSNLKPNIQGFSVIYNDTGVEGHTERIYILGYNPSDRILTTLIWFEGTLKGGYPSVYTNKFVKMNWEKS